MFLILVELYVLALICVGQGSLVCPPRSNKQCLSVSDQCKINTDCHRKGEGCCHIPECGWECVPLVPQGVCPKPPPYDVDYCKNKKFASGCNDDSDCAEEGKKCCRGGKCHVPGCETPSRNTNIEGCPVDDNVCIHYQQLCDKDSQCKKGEQCCYNPSCGTSCKPITLNRPGCPSSRICKTYQDLCKSDADCGKGKVCCYSSSCGRFCHVKQSKPNSQCRSVCNLPKVVGPCEALIPRYYYNRKTNKCEKFHFGGCQGNKNNFRTKKACEEKCDICQLPKAPGPCKAYLPSYYYDVTTKSCQRFIYGGCKGNENRFTTLEECENKCVDDICQLPKKTGPCKAYFPMYYYDVKTKSCQKFIYGGCDGNENRFSTLEECKTKCVSEDVCKLTKEPGPCRGSFPRYYYDEVQKTCLEFVYGGCKGNGNNFKTIEECQQRCGLGQICGPVCLIHCPFGNVLDSKGCPTCECKTSCENNAKPLQGIICGSGKQRCPGDYKCVTPDGSSAGVCCPNNKCPVLDCFKFMRCGYGFEVNENGCKICKCRSQPCPKIRCPRPCPEGFKQDKNGCPTCECIGEVNKPGVCPKNTDPGAICVALVRPEECINDANCYGKKKCCKQGCHRVCQDPGQDDQDRTSSSEPTQCLTCCGPPPCCGSCIQCAPGMSSTGKFCNVKGSSCAKDETCTKKPDVGSHGICCK